MAWPTALGQLRKSGLPGLPDRVADQVAEDGPLPDEQVPVEIGGDVGTLAFSKHDAVHVHACLGQIQVERCLTRPGDVERELDDAAARAGEVVYVLGQPASVPLLKDRGTRDRRCFR
jgi:hypothetical protein